MASLQLQFDLAPLPEEESFSVTQSEASTPSIECSNLLSQASTPATERSVLFEETCNDEYILVVGGLGYIGSHTSWELLKTGHNVIIIDNLSNSTRLVHEKLEYLRDSCFKNPTSRPTLDFHLTDYRNQERLREILAFYQGSSSPLRSKITGVIHFAAYKAVAESFQKPLAYYANNVSGLVDFCTTLGEFSIKTFVFSSSATVYGELANKGERLFEEQCNSSGCVGLTNPYGRTKWMCEAILSDLAHADPTWTIIALRYFNPIGCDESGVLGEEPRSVPNNLMPLVVKAMTGKLPMLKILGTDWDTPDGTAIRDFIHVSDLAQGHLAALKATKGPGFQHGYHVYNLGTGTGYSVKEIITTMQDVSGRLIPVRETGRREGDVGICIAEPSKSSVSLNWKSQRSLKRACWDICRYIGVIGESSNAVGFV
jgi:UDP-glucose 4-epimerase